MWGQCRCAGKGDEVPDNSALGQEGHKGLGQPVSQQKGAQTQGRGYTKDDGCELPHQREL